MTRLNSLKLHLYIRFSFYFALCFAVNVATYSQQTSCKRWIFPCRVVESRASHLYINFPFELPVASPFMKRYQNEGLGCFHTLLAVLWCTTDRIKTCPPVWYNGSANYLLPVRRRATTLPLLCTSTPVKVVYDVGAKNMEHTPVTGIPTFTRVGLRDLLPRNCRITISPACKVIPLL